LLNSPLARATVKTSFVLGLRLLVQGGTLLLVARMLGPGQFGIYAGITALAVLMGSFSNFGTQLVLLGEVSKGEVRRDQVLSYAVPTTLVSGSVLFLFYLLLCLFLFESGALSLQVLVCIGFAEIIILPLFLLPATEKLALGKTAYSQLLLVLPLSLRTLAAGVVLIAGTSHPLITFSWLYLATAILALGFIKLTDSDAWLAPGRWRLARIQELKHSAGYAVLSLTALGPNELDKMLAVKLLPLGASGLYAAASRVVGAVTLPVIALVLSALPRLFRENTSSSLQSRRLNHWVLGSVFVYSVVLAGGVWVFAPLIQRLFGDAYTGMEYFLTWLCIAVPGMSLRIGTASILMAMGRPWQRASLELFGMVSLVFSALIFFPAYGPIGMACALAVSEWGMFIVGYILIEVAQDRLK